MKKLLSLILTAVMLVCAAATVAGAEESPFTDVKTTRWSYEAIKYAVEQGYMNGVGDGKFDPAGSMTRGMVVTVLYRREGSPEVAFRDDFTDVKEGKYYSDAVIWAKDEGVVNGVTETTFEPNGKITREQLATMLSRFSERCLVSVPERADLSVYPDSAEVHSYAKDAMAWANEANLIKGMSDGTLSPRGNATREQFATILKRFDDTFNLVYNEPVLRSHYTEKEYPLVENADVYVATDGDDGNAGTFDAPVATFARAIERVREIKATKSSDITVAFKAGNYGPLSVSLTAEDTGSEGQRITYCAYGDGDVTFDNGTTVTADEFVPLDGADSGLFLDGNADRIRKAELKGRLDEFTVFDLVFSEDGELNVARFPNRYPDGTDHLQQGGRTVDDHHIAVWHRLLKNRIAKYHSTKGLYLYGYITLGWYKDLILTDGMEYDSESGDYVFYVPHPEETRGGHLRSPEDEGFVYDFYQMAIVNVSEELDAKGEYWIDRDTDTLYVFDPAGDYEFTGGGDMITMDHADYISFAGLNFRNTKGCMIIAEHCHASTITGCDFCGCGGPSAVTFRHCDSGRRYDIVVRDCEFSYTGSKGLEVNIHGPESDAITDSVALFTSSEGVVVDNNYFSHTCITIGNSSALAVHCFGPVVTHNEFVDCCWEGVDFRGSVNMTAEYNYFNNVCYNGDDTGMFNNWYSRDRCGNVVRYNLFLQSSGGTVNGAFALYLDDTTGTSVYSNIFYNTAVTAMNNGICKYNSFCDNLIIKPETDEGTGCRYHTGGTYAVLEAMENSDDPNVLKTVGEYNNWVRILNFFEEHPEFKAKAGDRWAGFFEITTDVEKWDTPEFCTNNSLIITGNREINAKGVEPDYDELIRRYSVIEDNVSYTSDENPFFVNPTIGDYRLRDDVTDFPMIEFEKIGRY